MKKHLSMQGISKNILDLEYHTILQQYNTNLIALITYTVALFFTISTKEIPFDNVKLLPVIITVTITYYAISTAIALKQKENMRKIMGQIKELV